MRYKPGVEKALKVLVSQSAKDNDLVIISCLSKFLHLDPDRRLCPDHALREDEYLKKLTSSDAFARDWILLRDKILACDGRERRRKADTNSKDDVLPNPSTPASRSHRGTRIKTPQDPKKSSTIRQTKLGGKRSTDDFLNELSQEDGESETDDLYDMSEEELFGLTKKRRT
eukprot:CAMPEP_0116048984 /NCGR_PEP_ID=MMETSP0321-20121206/29911_1 /TAXON_ID=163516 /ORGANISM="Leptocylindrus danicus var. danicus, Strain B650" /LENGTH=170 /DNA_ID=CAMNT_0003531357 /DNA_START=833 /DNA_END=1345 /DNA_ORIENTATION=-